MSGWLQGWGDGWEGGESAWRILTFCATVDAVGGGGRGGGKLICSVRIWIGSCSYMHTCKVHGDLGLAEVV